MLHKYPSYLTQFCLENANSFIYPSPKRWICYQSYLICWHNLQQEIFVTQTFKELTENSTDWVFLVYLADIFYTDAVGKKALRDTPCTLVVHKETCLVWWVFTIETCGLTCWICLLIDEFRNTCPRFREGSSKPNFMWGLQLAACCNILRADAWSDVKSLLVL